MSTIQERLLDRVRMDLGDLPQPFDFQFVGDGERDHFYVEHRPLDETSLVLTRDGAETDPTTEGVTYEPTTGMLVFDIAPPPGVIWEISGQKWRYFSDADLQVFIDTSVAQHAHNRADGGGGQYDDGDITPVEEYPVALYAVIQALWALATDASFDIDILAPDGVNIPRSERYRQLMEMIGARQTQYDEIAASLNIGIKRLEPVTVRRIAKNTNRLVPVYLPQEYDDRSRPKRVLYPPLLQGTPPIKSDIGSYDVDVVSGDPVSFSIQFPFDLTDSEITNAIRRSPQSARTTTLTRPVLEFTQEVTDAVNGIVKLSLTGSETRWLPYNAYWEIQVKRAGQTDSKTYLRGLVRATNNEVVR